MPKTTHNFNKYEYDRNYHKEHYYRLNVVLPKDYRKLIDSAAADESISKNAWIRAAIDEKLMRGND